MMIKYFKTHLWGDYYIAKDNYKEIISISKKDVAVISDDERIFEGVYKEINVSKKDFKKMKDFAIKNKRRNLIGLLNKVYQKNKSPLIDDAKLGKSLFIRNYFFNAKPILNNLLRIFNQQNYRKNK